VDDEKDEVKGSDDNQEEIETDDSKGKNLFEFEC